MASSPPASAGAWDGVDGVGCDAVDCCWVGVLEAAGSLFLSSSPPQPVATRARAAAGTTRNVLRFMAPSLPAPVRARHPEPAPIFAPRVIPMAPAADSC